MTIPGRDIVSGIVLGAGAIFLYVHTSGFPVREGQPQAVSPGFYPRLLAALMAVLSVLQIINALIAGRRNRKAAGTAGKKGPEMMPPLWKDRSAFVLFCGTVVALIVYPFLMELLGFAAAGILFLGTLIFALSGRGHSRREKMMMVLITIGIAAVTFVVFRTFLKIPFPRGIFFQR